MCRSQHSTHGDGNLHPTIVTRASDEAAARALTAFDEILDVALANGGTVTGEHGIGSLKREALAKEIDEIQMDLHSRIKESLDPQTSSTPARPSPAGNAGSSRLPHYRAASGVGE